MYNHKAHPQKNKTPKLTKAKRNFKNKECER